MNNVQTTVDGDEQPTRTRSTKRLVAPIRASKSRRRRSNPEVLGVRPCGDRRSCGLLARLFSAASSWIRISECVFRRKTISVPK